MIKLEKTGEKSKEKKTESLRKLYKHVSELADYSEADELVLINAGARKSEVWICRAGDPTFILSHERLSRDEANLLKAALYIADGYDLRIEH